MNAGIVPGPHPAHAVDPEAALNLPNDGLRGVGSVDLMRIGIIMRLPGLF